METDRADPAPAHRDIADPVPCDVGALERPDLRDVETLCRLRLAAGRSERRLVLLNAPPALRRLVVACGLAEVLPCPPDSGLEAER